MTETNIRPNEIYAACLASYLMKEGITHRQYAKMLGVDPTTPWRWISGQVACPQTNQLIKVCKIHGVDFAQSEAVGFAPRRNRRTGRSGHPLTSGSSGTEDVDVTDLLRRNLTFAAAGALFAAPIYPPLARLLDVDARVKLHVGKSDVTWLMDRTRSIAAGGHDGVAAGRAALLAEAQRGMRMLKGTFASDAVREQAFGAAASLVKYVGWNLYDQGFHDDARRMWITALAMTREADPEVASVIQTHTLQEMMLQAIALGQPRKALELAGMMSSQERELPSLQRASQSVVRATATAALGDVEETRRQIGWAQDHINDAADERDTRWNVNGWFHKAEMDGVASQAMTTLAVDHAYQRTEAREHATVSLERFPAGHSRAKARVVNALLKLHASSGDVAETEKAGAVALAMARQVRSPRVWGELFAIRPYLRPMKQHAGIRELDRGVEDLASSTA